MIVSFKCKSEIGEQRSSKQELNAVVILFILTDGDAERGKHKEHLNLKIFRSGQSSSILFAKQVS